MAVITITFPDELGVNSTFNIEYSDEANSKILNSLSKIYGYNESVPNPFYMPAQPVSENNKPTISNPLTKIEFIARKVVDEIIKRAVQEEEQLLRLQLESQIRSQIDEMVSVSISKV